MRTRYAVANWKMNLPAEGIDSYTEALRPPSTVRMVVAPPFPYLKQLRGKVPLAGQNCADQRSGAFTGEVSPVMLRECGAEFVILGHSERRTVFGESDGLIGRKVKLALEIGLTPILCVGEGQKERDSGKAAIFVANQIKSTAPESAAEIVVAYEPIWAIGTGRNATGAMVAEMVAEIRAALGRFWPAGAEERTSILYGGSVTPENIGDLGEHGNIDGYLVGGSCLHSSKFSAICAGAASLATA